MRRPTICTVFLSAATIRRRCASCRKPDTWTCAKRAARCTATLCCRSWSVTWNWLAGQAPKTGKPDRGLALSQHTNEHAQDLDVLGVVHDNGAQFLVGRLQANVIGLAVE